MPKYIILNDGEIFTTLEGCVIFDSDNNRVYTIRKNKEIDTTSDMANMHWEKGIADILGKRME